MPSAHDAAFTALVERAFARLRQVRPDLLDDPARQSSFRQLILASDFAIDTLCRQPFLIDELDDPPRPPPPLLPEHEADWPASLRRWRAAESTRLVWRDVTGVDSVEDTLAGSSRIAEQALQAGLDALAAQFAARHGIVRDEHGNTQSLVVFGLGKLGGGELNFSSDIDLIYAFAEHGDSDGARPLDAETYFTRIGQRLAQLLGEVTADGFSHRVDLRLRPFGASGRIALSFAAMEQYYQREGRDWERYAWIKARPVAGDLAAGDRLLETLRPFVYRRYLDYSALDGLREMKALIDAEVSRRELADHLKLGPGGIREVEFLAQALQLIRGGRDTRLRQKSLLAALAELADAGHLDGENARQLADAYRYLRRIENRVQMLADQQVHSLPEDALVRERIARGLGLADTSVLLSELDHHRAVVSAAFDGLLQSRRAEPEVNALARYWRALPDGGAASALTEAGFGGAEAMHVRLRDFALSPAVRGLSERARQRLDRVLPALLEASARSSAPDAALSRGLALLQAIARRTSYLALLDEQPVALARLVDVTSRSALIAERLAEHPLLLDELLDARLASVAPTAADLDARIAHDLQAVAPGDTEAALTVLNEVRQSASFRIALSRFRSGSRRATAPASWRSSRRRSCARCVRWPRRNCAPCMATFRAQVSRSSRTAASAVRSSVSVRTSTSSSCTMRPAMKSPMVRGRSKPRAISPGSRKSWSACSARRPRPAGCTTPTCGCVPTARKDCWCRRWRVFPNTSANARGPGSNRRWCAHARWRAMRACWPVSSASATRCWSRRATVKNCAPT
jgi:[glutamine synthetase] adenylyltransferase / [glutamine synthetase]-adenylyl-L-tyrosine phosphorylase